MHHEIKLWLMRFLRGDITLVHFTEWFVPATWDLKDPEAKSLVNAVLTALEAYSVDRRMPEEELRDRLATLAANT